MHLLLSSFVIITSIFFSPSTFATPISANSFRTNANFSVDKTSLHLTSVVATIEDRFGAPGYSWIRIYFYSFLPDDNDLSHITNGDISSMENKWTKLADRHDNSYNTSNAFIQLTVDRNFKVWQVDMAIPGKSCTITPTEQDLKQFRQDFKFDGKHCI